VIVISYAVKAWGRGDDRTAGPLTRSIHHGSKLATKGDDGAIAEVTSTSYLSLKDVSTRIRRREISPIEVVRDCVARIEALNPKINALITILREQAEAEARTAEQEIMYGHWRSPLHGIPIAIKDMFDTAGVRTTAAFEHFKDRVPVKDAVAVRPTTNSPSFSLHISMETRHLGAGSTRFNGIARTKGNGTLRSEQCMGNRRAR